MTDHDTTRRARPRSSSPRRAARLRRRDPGIPSREGRVLQDLGRQPDPAPRSATRSPGCPYYPVNVDLVFEGLSLAPYTGDEPSDFEIPTSDGRQRPARRAGTFTLPGRRRAAPPDGLRARGRPRGRPRFRAVPRRDERPRDLRRRPVPRPRAGRGRHVRDRLQPGLPPVVRLPAEVLVPADARRRTACRTASRPASDSPRAPHH